MTRGIDKALERRLRELAGLICSVCDQPLTSNTALDGEGGGMHDRCRLRSAPVDEDASEKEFQSRVIELAESLGWDWHHQTISKRSKSGWPDLALFRERVVMIELKSENGRLDAAQERWRDVVVAAGIEWYCFRPSQWAEIVEVLTRRGG